MARVFGEIPPALLAVPLSAAFPRGAGAVLVGATWHEGTLLEPAAPSLPAQDRVCHRIFRAFWKGKEKSPKATLRQLYSLLQSWQQGHQQGSSGLCRGLCPEMIFVVVCT